MSAIEIRQRTRGCARVVRIALAMAAAVLAFPSQADAGFSYRIASGTTTLNQGDFAVFTIYLDATADAPALSLTKSTVALSLTGVTAGVTFGAIDSPPDSSYVFESNQGIFTEKLYNSIGGTLIDSPRDGSGNLINPGTPSGPRYPNFDTQPYARYISIYGETDVGTVTLNPAGSATSWKLGTFAILNRASPGGTVNIEFDQGPTSLGNGSEPLLKPNFPDNPYSFHVNGGPLATPAPPSLVMALTGCACLFATRLRRRFHAA